MPFPSDFLWGSATSAHQVEGGNFNSDWYAWEQIPGNIHDESTSEIAADSWNKYKEDVQLLKDTNQNAYRLSIEWAKIEPKKDQFDQDAIDHYKKQFQLLKKNNIKIMATLFHFTLPQWAAQSGGFTNKETIKYFIRYAEKMILELKDEIDLWATINEPLVYTLKGYLLGDWCPSHKNPYEFIKVWNNLAISHNQIYNQIKKHHPDIQVGIVINLADYQSSEKSYLNHFLTNLVKIFGNDLFTRKIVNHTDFLGINYYMTFFIQPHRPIYKYDSAPKSDIGWPIHPENIYNVIKENIKWNKPIYITENGIADRNDKYRGEFIQKSLKAIEKSINEGAPIKGYFHWSLLDNFEWAEGYAMKFGLHTIDRKPRPSAKIYSELIKKYQQEAQ